MKTFDTRPAFIAATAVLWMSQDAAAQAPAPPAADQAPVQVAAPAGSSVTVDASAGTGVDWALKQDEIKNDPAGQWAVSATASSTYSDATGQARFSAWQATGFQDSRCRDRMDQSGLQQAGRGHRCAHP